MGAFVVVTAGRSETGGQIDAPHVFEKLMLLQLSEGLWPHGTEGPSEQGLQPNDVVLFCLIGETGAELIGEALVAARSTPLTPQRLGQIRMYLGPALPPDPQAFTHSVVLTQLNIWEHPRPCQQDEPVGAEVLAVLEGAGRTGVVRPISPAAFESVVGHPVFDLPDEAATEETAPEPAHDMSHACDVKEFLLANWALVDSGEPLQPVNGSQNGGRLSTPAGPVDLLCEAADSQDLVAVMWANGEPPSELLAAVRERLAWVRENTGGESRRVRGLILTLDDRPELATADGDEIQVRRLRIWCEPVRRPNAYRPDPVDVAGNLAATALVPQREIREPIPAMAVVGAGRNGGAKPAPPVDLDFAAKCLRVPRASGGH